MTDRTIRGAKGGGGGGRTPVEAQDSLRSHAYARVVDLISEGEIQGLVNGEKSILLDGVPLRSLDGTPNFADYFVDWRYGSQGQTSMDQFSAQENEISVNAEVTVDTPLTRAITNVSVDAVRVTLSFPALYETNTENGDVTGTSVEYAIDVQSAGGGFVEQFRQTISGKNAGGYQRSVRIALAGASPWDVRVRRITPDSTSQYLQNATWWASYTEIISTRMRYPNSALVGLAIDSQQFASIPTRGYDCLGVRVRVPVNYDPITRVYTGNWDGTFKVAWTNNPAWLFFEVLTNDRWGLGRFVDEALINKWSLYTIGRYCDEQVPDGKGGTEPRFTLNAYLQTQAEAYDLVQALASVFRGMVFWGAGGIDLAQDAPADPVALYTNGNVVDGVFRYEDTSAKARHTVAIVQWNDPADQFRAKQVYVEDAAGIARYGVVPAQIAAFGCTSAGQAVRAGKWLLHSDIHEIEVVTFRVGLEGVLATPGQVIDIADARRAGERTGGRVRAATQTQVTLDAPVTLNPGETYTLLLVDPDGATPVVSRAVTDGAGTHQTLTLASPLTNAPPAQSVWVLSSDLLVPTTWRVLSVSEEEDSNTFAITAVAHNPSKYGAVEQGLKLEEYPTSRPAARIAPPTNLQLREIVAVDKDGVVRVRLNVAWTPSQPGQRYRVSWRREIGDWMHVPDTTQQSIDILDAALGSYEIEVYAIGPLGDASTPLAGTITLDGKTDGPPAPLTFGVTASGDGTRKYVWTMSSPVPADLSGFEVRYVPGATGTWDTMETAFSLAAAAGSLDVWQYDSILPPAAGTYTFGIKSIDTSGNFSADATYASGVILADAGLNAAVAAVVVDAPTDIFKVDQAGNPVNASITLTATLAGGLTGFVTWSAGDGWTGTPPTGSNIWTIDAADQTADAVTYTATLDQGGTYTDSITLVRLRDGSNALTALLTNEAHTVPASADGDVTSWTGAGGQMRVYLGTTQLVSGVTYAIQANPNSLTASIDSFGSYSVTGAGSWSAASNTTTLTLRATHTPSGTTLDKVFTVTKSLQGEPGEALAITLQPSSLVFRVDKAGLPTPTSITIGTYKQGTTGIVNWSTTPAISGLDGTTGNAKTLSYNGVAPAMGANNSVQITATVAGVSDRITVVKVFEGSDSVAAVLSNEAHTVPADADGSNPNLAGASSTMTVYVGATDDSTNWTYATTASGVTITGANTRTVTVTAMSGDTGYVDITASRTGYSSVTRRFSLAKSRKGTAGASGAPGARGSLRGNGAQYGISTASWVDGLANRVIYNMLNGETLQSSLASTTHLALGDWVTLGNGTTFAQDRYWSGTAWLAPGTVIDGNLLVNGTLSASKLTTGSFTATGSHGIIRINETPTQFGAQIPFSVSRVNNTNRALFVVSDDGYGAPVVSVPMVDLWARGYVLRANSFGLTADAASATHYAVESQGTAKAAFAASGYHATAAIYGFNSFANAPGVKCGALSGFGGHFVGNATRAPVLLEQLADLPTNRAAGSICFFNGWLCFANGAHWFTSAGIQLT